MSTTDDASQLLALSRDLKAIGKDAIKSLRVALRTAATPVKNSAASNISGTNAAVAKSITVQTSFTGKKCGVFIIAKRNKMPAGKEALPGLYEMGGKGGGGNWRHPVFGKEATWVTQQGHKFLAPALNQHASSVYDQVNSAIDELITAHKL